MWANNISDDTKQYQPIPDSAENHESWQKIENFKMCPTNLIVDSVHLSLPVWELHCLIAILINADHCAVSKDTLFRAVRE